LAQQDVGLGFAQLGRERTEVRPLVESGQ